MAKKVYAITHNDLDGIGCAVLLEKVYPQIQTYAIDYRELNEVLPNILKEAGKETLVYLTDISLNEQQAQICNEFKVQHIDHHSSSMKLMSKYDWSFTDPSHCATYHLYNMLCQYANIQDYKKFVDLVDSYDTWGHGTEPSPEAFDLNRLLKMIGAETFVARFKLSGSVNLSKTEKAIVEADKFQEEQYLNFALSRTQLVKDAQGRNVGIVAAEQYTSSLGNFILNQVPELDYVVILDMLRDKASLRSKGKVNVGEIAKECGGGGHPKAAGFQMNEAALKAFWRSNE